ncbi:MAG: hypothetical protein ACRDQ4_24005 [Pseudonocardiaceae bacterium]
MEPVWNGLVVLDYEHSRPDATLLEWDLYTTSLIAWPRAWMDEPTPYGRLRRPGIVDIEHGIHDSLIAQLEEYLADPGRARLMVTRAQARQARTDAALSAAEDALADGRPASAAPALVAATAVFLDVMSTHIVNWLLPEQQWEDLLASLFADRAQARSCLLTFSTPDCSHLLDAHRIVLQAVADVRQGTPIEQAAAMVSARAGTLYGSGSPAATAMPLEDPDRAADLVRSAAEAADPETHLAAITGARTRAAALREAWETAAVLAAAGNADALARVRAIAIVLGWAAESEERRKVLRHRYLSAVRRWCESTGADARRITTTDLFALGAR